MRGLRLPREAAPELAAFLLGCGLRLRLLVSFDPHWGYDAGPHFQVARTLAQTGAPPPLATNYVAYHPSLYYWIYAAAVRLHAGMEGMQVLSVAFGIARLALLWWGLRRWVPSRLGRATALGLAAVLPCAVHLDGMVSNETLLALSATAALLLLPATLSAAGRTRWLHAAGLLLALAVALASKLSALVLLALVGAAALARLFGAGGPLPQRLWRAAPLALAAAGALALALPFYAHNRPETGHFFANSMETTAGQRELAAQVAGVPYGERRPRAYFLGLGGGAILRRPVYPQDSAGEAHLLPVLLAATFGDYYNRRYAGRPALGEPQIVVNERSLSLRHLAWMRVAVGAGVPIALATAAAAVLALIVVVRRRDLAATLVVGAPLLALAGLVHVVLEFPFDQLGPVKGHYLQFAAAPLFGLFGLGVSWLWQRPRLRVLAALELAALGVLAAYSVYARLTLLPD